jgi:hypothetical protein
MGSTTTLVRRLATVAMTAAILGVHTLASASTATADPAPSTTWADTYQIWNDNRQKVVFVGYDTGKGLEPAVSGPSPNAKLSPGLYVPFDITAWFLGDKQTNAVFQSEDGKHRWTVGMKNDISDRRISCVTADGCSPVIGYGVWKIGQQVHLSGA